MVKLSSSAWVLATGILVIAPGIAHPQSRPARNYGIFETGLALYRSATVAPSESFAVPTTPAGLEVGFGWRILIADAACIEAMLVTSLPPTVPEVKESGLAYQLPSVGGRWMLGETSLGVAVGYPIWHLGQTLTYRMQSIRSWHLDIEHSFQEEIQLFGIELPFYWGIRYSWFRARITDSIGIDSRFSYRIVLFRTGVYFSRR